MMNERDKTELWARLKDFDLDNPESKLRFSDRLARENGWTEAYTLRVLEEYKRFIYLCRVAGHPVTPSDEVDQAWLEDVAAASAASLDETDPLPSSEPQPPAFPGLLGGGGRIHRPSIYRRQFWCLHQNDYVIVFVVRTAFIDLYKSRK